MSQFYLNGPSIGGAMSAEEFAAGINRRSGPQPCPPPADGCDCGCDYGCGGTAPDCPDSACGQEPSCCQQMICCCRPAPAPAPRPPQVDEGCCCKQSFRAALGLLCDQQLSSLLDFDTAAFITNTYTAGAVLTPLTPPAPPVEEAPAEDAAASKAAAVMTSADNLAAALTGSFRRFAPCSCDLLDIDADLYTAAGAAVGFTASQVSLCELDAVVIQGAEAAAEGELSAAEVTARNFRCLRQQLAQRLNPCGGPCGQDWCSCSCACDGRDCCCAAGLLNALAQNNLSRRVSVAAGLLVLRNVTLLGTVGNVLVLSNDTDNRLYFVCVNSVQFVG